MNTIQSVTDLPLAWSEPKATTYGDRPASLRTAPLPFKSTEADTFWNLYRAHKADLSRATDADVQLPCPEGLAYLPYQKAGIAFAVSRDAALIADEMGLGKTIQ